ALAIAGLVGLVARRGRVADQAVARAVADEDAVPAADADPAIARGAEVGLEGLVHRAVAVVVERVAGGLALLEGRGRVHADEAVDPAARGLRGGADAVRVAEAGRDGDVLVGVAVAVVVPAVTDLGSGELALVLAARQIRVEVVEPAVAGGDHARGRDALRGRVREVARVAARAAVADVRLEEEVLVDVRVAVVVRAVAQLDRRARGALTDEAAALTDEETRFAEP